MKACPIKCLSTYVPLLIFLIMIETRDDAGDNKSSFSAMKVENRSTTVRAYRNNKKDTIGRKCHRRNAQENLSSAERYFADRETL